MTANRLLGAAALLLAACGAGEKAADSGMNEAAAAPESLPARKPASSPGPAPGPAPAKASKEGSIPSAFHGVYDVAAEACGRPGDGALTVTADALRFHESVGSVREVTSQPSGAIRVDADYRGEGETWRSSRELRLSKDGSKLTVVSDGSSFDRVRCPAGTP